MGLFIAGMFVGAVIATITVCACAQSSTISQFDEAFGMGVDYANHLHRQDEDREAMRAAR